jgi:hypothetical protein
MLTSGTDVVPALFRAGDIGVSSEWRDLTYDWWPLLTADGVFTYSYLRDVFDKQRTLRPFILNPEGPPKQRIQRVLQRRTEYGVQGPEYLLETVGLLYIEVQRGPSPDPTRPKHTTVTNYVVGYLERAVLDWTMVERVLDALMIGLGLAADEQHMARRQKRALAAIRSLGLAGMLQNEDPEYLFEPDGAWVTLLPRLIQDARWETLFTSLHGVEALVAYRRQARAWVELARRRAERLLQENNIIRDQLLAAQRRPVRGQVHTDTYAAPHLGTTNKHDVPEDTLAIQEPSTQHSVPGEEIESPGATRVIGEPSGTEGLVAGCVEPLPQETPVPAESQATDHINDRWSSGKDTSSSCGTASSEGTRSQANDGFVPENVISIPSVAEHVHESELATIRLDAYFWTTVHKILQDDSGERYSYTAAERKAVQRLIGKHNVSIGVLLAALRAIMTVPTFARPQTLGDVLKLDIFHTCVEQAAAIVPALAPHGTHGGSWHEFMEVYRTVGQTDHLRNVHPTEWPLIADLFERQPVACWAVLRRVQQMAEPPQLSYEYLKRAVINNQRVAATQSVQPLHDKEICRPNWKGSTRRGEARVEDASREIDDSRRALLEGEGINPHLLTPAMTIELIQAWIAEADVRRDTIEKRAGWIAWGLKKERMPQDVPELGRRPLPQQHDNAGPSCDTGTASSTPLNAQGHVWEVVLTNLEQQLSRTEFDTWLRESVLVELDDEQAFVGVTNVFAREKVDERYSGAIAQALERVLGRPIRVRTVIGFN